MLTKDFVVCWIFVFVVCMFPAELCFAPQVHCDGICNDLTRDLLVDEIEFLTVIGEYGESPWPDHDSLEATTGIGTICGKLNSIAAVIFMWLMQTL